jgi:EmrB/QacA subfamily drug resistance transporter
MDQFTSGGRRIPSWAVLAICCAAQFMVVLDVVIVNVALPQMRDSLGLSVTGEQWVVNAYTLTFAGFLMLGGRAADLFGRRRVFIIGLAVFTLCSLLGGAAQNGPWLIAARAAQGLGGAILAPATLSILVTSFTDLGERRKALGAWSATAASGAAAGVLAGGILTSYLGWRWVLFVNIPIGVVLLAGAWLALPRETARTERRPLDIAGAVTVTAGLAVVVYGIVSTDIYPWASARTIITLAIGALLLLAFVVTESRIAKDPLIPLGIFKRRSLAAANGIAVTIGAGLFGFYFFLSLYLQVVNGYSPLRTGLAFLPAGLSTLTGALVGTRTVQVLGPRRQLVLGPGLAAAGLLWLSTLQAGDPYLTHVLVPLILVGAGIGMSFVPMTLAATAGVPVHEAGLASGLINTTRQIGGALGLAIMATAAATATSHQIHGTHASGSALTAGYTWAFAIAGGGLVIGALLALLLPVPEKVPEAVTSGDEIVEPFVVVENQ